MSEAEKSPSILDRFIAFWTSIQLTIACLALGFVLVFVGTLAQRTLSIDEALQRYFSTWIVWVWRPDGTRVIPIFPGGFLVGAVLLVNLIAAHLYRFQMRWRKSGLFLTHVGLILLILGGVFTSLFSQESYMRITEGETKAYSESHREMELAIIDRSDPAIDKVVAVAESALAKGGAIQDPALPFRLNVLEYYANSQITGRAAAATAPTPAPVATMGVGTQYSAREIPRTSKENERDRTVVWVELVGTGGPLGTWMASNVFEEAQPFTCEGKPYTLELRPRRSYKPYSLSLLDFAHEVYPGTEIPRNFSSKVRLVDPRRSEDREVLIYMNSPLRYDGRTFYQSSYEGETTTVLQVVENPSRLLPYISCVLVGLGLLVQFGIHLTAFFKRRAAAATA